MSWKGILNAYSESLPLTEQTPALSLMEGNTPLIPLPYLSEQLGIQLYGKYEGANPTGSFKDRGMVLAVAKAKEAGNEAIICASTGNTSASAAAYGARAGIRTIIVIPKGKVALGKLSQAMMYGAEIFEIEGNFDDALALVKDLATSDTIELVNSVNAYRIEGQKTAAFEVCEQLGYAPDILSIPVGNAGNISAYWQGFKEYHSAAGAALPKMYGFEAEGSAAIAKGRVIQEPETIATAIRIGHPASWSLANAATDESEGMIGWVSDDEIIDMYQTLARREGVFVEPASCAGLAGIKQQVAAGQVPEGSTVVAVMTGNGLKDPTTASECFQKAGNIIRGDADYLKSQLKASVANG